MNLRTLTDDELLRHAYAQHSPLTTTDLEAEMFRRFADVADERDGLQYVLSTQNEAGLCIETPEEADRVASLVELAEEFSGWDIRGLLEVLRDHDFDNPEALDALLTRDEAAL